MSDRSELLTDEHPLTGELLAFIENPKGSRNKYEYDEVLGEVVLDRFLSSSTVYPTDYGYLIGHRGRDGDPLDAMVCVSEPTFPGCVIPVKPIALFKMWDEKGEDDKLIVGRAQEHKLRLLARSTWLYFEHFVGPEDRWLPPDHFQEDPRGLVAHRTSPTNIGLMLLSTLSAHDLGYIGPLELSLRLRDSLDSMDKLERVRGHFLNWYDTRSFAPLPPRYISTVDSGNLVACLIALRQGCYDMKNTRIVNWEGLLDTLGMLSLSLVQARLGNAADELHGAIAALEKHVRALNDPEQFSPAMLKELFREDQVQHVSRIRGKGVHRGDPVHQRCGDRRHLFRESH